MTSMASDDPNMERRVSSLEGSLGRIEAKLESLPRLDARLEKLDSKLDTKLEKLDSKLDATLEKLGSKLDGLVDQLHAFQTDNERRLTRIETILESKASNAEVAELRGSIRSLPTTMQLITLVFGILAGAFAIVRFGLPHP